MNRRTWQDYFLYDEINDKAFRDLSILFEEPEDVCIRLNSHGGGIFDAISIYNMICNNHEKTTVIIDGIAAGAASFLFLGAKRRIIAESAMIILTEPWVISMEEELEKNSTEIEKLKNKMVDIYEKHTKLKRGDILEYMRAEKVIESDFAVQYGLVDEIMWGG